MLRALPFFLFALIATAAPGANPSKLAVTITDDGDPVEYAVASLTPLDSAVMENYPHDDAVIAQEDKEYDPYVTAVMVGTKASFPNRDIVQHHIYSVSKAKRFEKPLYAPGSSETEVFDKVGIVTLGCNIHDWMVAYVIVLPTPWFKKTGPEGVAILAGMPPGRYELQVWQPRISKVIKQEITLHEGDNPAIEVSVKLKPDRRIRRAPTGRSGGY